MANPSEHEPPKFLTPSIRLNSFPLADERTDRQSIDATLDQSSDDEPQRLERRLRRRAVSHADPNTGQSFWGYALLKDIMTRERVVEELLSAKKLSLSRSEAERLCQQIVPPSFTPENHHRRPEQPAYLAIFALLVLARRTRDVQDFLIPDFSDGRIISANLPLIGTPIIDRCRWKDTQFDTYDKHRRGVLVPYFDTGTGTIVEVSPHQELPEGTLLPWLKDKDEGGGTHRVKTGGYGSVTTYRIDPDSHSFWRLLNPVGLHSELVAVKCLNPSKHPDLVAFHKEVAMLKLYGAEARQNATKPDDRAHQHIITLLATYQQGDNYCFVFPAADCDLDDYIRKKPGLLELPQDSPGSAINAGTARWLSEQIVGLVAAVNLMHGDNPDRLTANPKFTRHGDLKLENILWFRSKTNKNGIFVVGDLGLADIHGENSRSNVANENLPVTMTYRAPECDIKGANISRAYDIWTLGCVFLEIIAWALGGNAQRVKFSRERIKTSQFARTNMYFDIIKRKEDGKFAFRVKKVVTEVRSTVVNKAKKAVIYPPTYRLLTVPSKEHRRAAQVAWVHALHSCSSRCYQHKDAEGQAHGSEAGRRASRGTRKNASKGRY